MLHFGCLITFWVHLENMVVSATIVLLTQWPLVLSNLPVKFNYFRKTLHLKMFDKVLIHVWDLIKDPGSNYLQAGSYSLKLVVWTISGRPCRSSTKWSRWDYVKLIPIRGTLTLQAWPKRSSWCVKCLSATPSGYLCQQHFIPWVNWRHKPYLEWAFQNGLLTDGNDVPYYFCWHQHFSQAANFSIPKYFNKNNCSKHVIKKIADIRKK